MTFVHLDSVIKLVQIINEQNTHYVKGILHINSIPNRSIEITPGEDQEDLNCYKKENNERWELLDLLEKCTSYVMESYFQFWFKFDRSVFNLKWSKKVNEKDNNKTKGDWWTKHKQNRRFFFMRKAHRYNSQAPDRTPFLLPPSKTRTKTQTKWNQCTQCIML